MKLILLNIVFVLLLFSGCEKSEIVDAEIPYEEYIVVQAELKSEDLFKGVSITRTLPPGVEYNILTAELKDVTAYLKIDGVKIIPLHYTFNGIYKPLYDLLIKSGSTYEIYGERGNSRFYASTAVPSVPRVGIARYNTHTFSIDVSVNPRQTEVYGAVWVIGNYLDMAVNYSSISVPGELKDTITVSTSVIPEKYRTSAYAFMKYYKIYSYDAPYYQFYKSIKNNEPVNNVFLQGSGSILWNVTGNNAIGLFIGFAEGDLRYVN